MTEKIQNYFSEYRKREAKINFDCYFLYVIWYIIVHIVYMHSFNFTKIFSFDISNRYFYCFAYWFLLSSFLLCLLPTRFLPQKVFCLFPVRGLRVSARVCSRTRKPQNVLISNFFEVSRLYLILSTFLSIPRAQGTTLIK